MADLSNVRSSDSIHWCSEVLRRMRLREAHTKTPLRIHEEALFDSALARAISSVLRYFRRAEFGDLGLDLGVVGLDTGVGSDPAVADHALAVDDKD